MSSRSLVLVSSGVAFMFRLSVFTTACLILCSLAHAQTPVTAEKEPSSAKDSPVKLTAAVKEIAADLHEARELLKKVADKATRERLELLLTRAELRAVELEKSLAGLTTTSAPSPLSADDFAKLLKALKAESFDEGKGSFIASWAPKGRLSCAQARELLKTFSFDEQRINSAVAIYPRLTDPENFFTVLDVFTFSSSKDTLREKLKGK
jgi:hypothetical protein